MSPWRGLKSRFQVPGLFADKERHRTRGRKCVRVRRGVFQWQLPTWRATRQIQPQHDKPGISVQVMQRYVKFEESKGFKFLVCAHFGKSLWRAQPATRCSRGGFFLLWISKGSTYQMALSGFICWPNIQQIDYFWPELTQLCQIECFRWF